MREWEARFAPLLAEQYGVVASPTLLYFQGELMADAPAALDRELRLAKAWLRHRMQDAESL